MMVINGTVAAWVGAGPTNGNTFNIPADRCVWTQEDDERGYSVSDVHFVGLTHSSSGSTTGSYVAVTNAKLGFIGKSGRFVAVSN